MVRPAEARVTCLWLDAACIKARRAGPLISVATKVAVAVDSNRRREVRCLTPKTVVAFCEDTTMDPAKIAAL